MSLLKKYRYYEQGIVKYGVNETMQKFFKTKPTEEQIMLLDEIDKKNNILLWMALLVYFILGIFLGYALTTFYFVIQQAIGV